MAKLAELRKKAKGLGISAAVIRRATTASELQDAIDAHSGSSKPKAKAKAKGKGKSTTARKQTRNAPAKKKASGRKASTPAKSRNSGKAKRSSNSTSSREPKGGRNLLGKVNFSKTEGWNPREGSAPDLIIRALKRFKGDREKVFNHLKGDMWDFVQKKKQNGDKRTKAEAEAMLRYRISRTAFDFAVRTGQHEPSDNRVEYGTGGTGEGIFKRAKSVVEKGTGSRKAAGKKKTVAKKNTGRKPGRKVGGARKASGRKAKARR